MPAPTLPLSSGTIHPIYARQLRMLLQQVAQDGDRALTAAHLDWSTLLTDDRCLSRKTVTRLVMAALAITQKPWLGLELAATLPITAHGPLGYAAVTARDLSGCLTSIVNYGALRNDAFGWSMRPTTKSVVFQATEQSDWGGARWFVIDLLVGSVLSLIKAAVGHLPEGMTVDIPMTSPGWAPQYSRFIPVDIRFGQPVLAFHVSLTALKQPCLGADTHAHAAALRECEIELAKMTKQRLSDRVTHLLADTPSGGYPKLTEIATSCNLTPRTFMRHLNAEGTSFQVLLDMSQQAKALWLLQHTSLSVEEIASQLGYLDTSNFSRTVRRWFGLTPRLLRDAASPSL